MLIAPRVPGPDWPPVLMDGGTSVGRLDQPEMPMLALMSYWMLLLSPSLRCRRWSGMAVVALALMVPCWVLAAENFLPPEQAFRVSAQRASPDRAEVLVRIAAGYYVYREPLRFRAEGTTLGTPEIPTGKVKFDENFQKNVETYRGDLRIVLPLSPGTAAFKLSVVTQGCADAGLCYPPMTTELQLDLSTAVPSPKPAVAATSNGESARIEDVLRSGKVWRVVAVFFGLGVLLAFTPCVLPMLPILSSLIVGTESRPSRRRGLLLAAAYSLGMALIYTAMGVAAGLAGEGFAAALQSPWAIAVFSLLLAAFALSMFDLYELRLPARFTSRMTQHCNRLPAGRLLGVFLMGGVSALIVSPCITAPLAGALLFISQSGDVVKGGAALFSMAAGMSLPLLLLGASAGRWVPKAGVWMHSVKCFFGLLMLGVALWVAQPILPVAAVLMLWGMLLLLTGFLLQPFSSAPLHRHVLRHVLQRALGLMVLTLGLAQIVGALTGAQDPLRPLAGLGATNPQGATPGFTVIHSESDLAAAIQAAAGRPVVLDFYADWCVSCKEMERFTFSDAAVAARLGAAVLLKADVTGNTDEHRALLRRFQLFGPPGTLFFDAQGQEIAAARVLGFQSAKQFAATLSRAGL